MFLRLISSKLIFFFYVIVSFAYIYFEMDLRNNYIEIDFHLVTNDLSIKLSIYLLYTLPRNINGYVPFLINRLDTILRWVFLLSSHH